MAMNLIATRLNLLNMINAIYSLIHEISDFQSVGHVAVFSAPQSWHTSERKQCDTYIMMS